jgi:hypothetical protein
MLKIYILCIRKSETVSYLQYVYVLDFVFKTRGSQEPVIAHLVLNLISKLIENGGVTHNFESEAPTDHFNSNFRF